MVENSISNTRSKSAPVWGVGGLVLLNKKWWWEGKLFTKTYRRQASQSENDLSCLGDSRYNEQIDLKD